MYYYPTLQGVDVGSGKRWSWILWFRDSTTCDDHSFEWFQGCAEAEPANPVCQMLFSTVVAKRSKCFV